MLVGFRNPSPSSALQGDFGDLATYLPGYICKAKKVCM